MAADGYWNHGGSGQHHPPMGAAPPAPTKRPRFDYGEIPGGPQYFGSYARDEGRMGQYAELSHTAYDSYSYHGISALGQSIRPMTGGMNRPGGMDGRMVGHVGGRPEAHLPPDASNTLFAEGLPADCTRREVSHIFRPFVGFKEVRLVNKESRYPGGAPWIMCFVDFSTPGQAAIALDALQGYVFDEHDSQSSILRLQFARVPGQRSKGGPHSRR